MTLKIAEKFIFITAVYLFAACRPTIQTDLPLFTVAHSDFEDIITVDGYVEPVKSTTVSCPRNIEGTITFLVEDGTHVNEDDVICIIDDTNVSTGYDEAMTNLENAEANMNKTRATLEMQFALLEAQVQNNEAETAIAQLDSLQLKFSSENQRRIRELELERTTIDKRKYAQKLRSLKQIQQSEIRKIELEIQRARMYVQRMTDMKESLTIRAPQSGLALRGRSYISGRKLVVSDIVWEGMPIITLPELTVMKVKILATEGNYKRISVNDSVEYRFDAMPDNKAWGIIAKKAPIGQPITQNSKVKVFEIEASVDSFITIPGPGLSVSCDIILKKISDTIVIPQIAIFDEDSLKVVFVKNKKGYEMREVATGISSSKEVIISKGLNRLDEIALLKPSTSLISSKLLLSDTTTTTPTQKNSTPELK